MFSLILNLVAKKHWKNSKKLGEIEGEQFLCVFSGNRIASYLNINNWFGIVIDSESTSNPHIKNKHLIKL